MGEKRQRGLDLENIYEPETLRVFDAVLKEGDSVIVAGAHQGFFVSYISKLVGKTGKVYGFEPETKNFQLLKEKVGDLENVEIFNIALGDREANAKLYFNSDNDGGHALWDVSQNKENVKTKENFVVEKVEVKTLDGLFPNGVENLKLIMLDAEGSEHSILKGGINTIIDSEVPFIICEINDLALDRCGTSQMNLRSYLSVYGFTPYAMNEEKVVDVHKDKVKAFTPDLKQEVVFNMLFSRRGKV
jgi:FkbM family methyltransferase